LQLGHSQEAELAVTEIKRSKEIKLFVEEKFVSTNSDDEWTRNVTNSKTAQAIVMSGLIVSFSVIIIGETLHGIKNIITKPFFRKRSDDVGRSSDLY
jgi:hypothetical protein